jgi:hypothetical protein
MKRLILKLALLCVLAGVYAFGDASIVCFPAPSCPVCVPGTGPHFCGTCCACNCT